MNSQLKIKSVNKKLIQTVKAFLQNILKFMFNNM